MFPRAKWLALSLFTVVATLPALASLKDIRTEKLPQDKAVLQAYSEMLTIEDMVHDWSGQWRYSTPKEQVVAKVESSLAALKTAVAAAPDSVELLLLTGLVAHYGYNIDVPDTYDLAMTSFEGAHKLAPDDYRAEWFTGMHQCQTVHPEEGMEKLLGVEHLLGTRETPTSFWDDYISCSSVTVMPAHVLRAADRAKQSGAPPSAMRDFLVGGAQKRFKTPDPAATYTAKEVWASKQLGSGPVVLTNSLCGFSIISQGTWHLGLSDTQKVTCAIQLEAGPYKGRTGDVFPYLLVLARQPKPGETLEAFAKAAARGASPTENRGGTCPAESCLQFDAASPQTYKPEGGGHFIVTVFQRNAPQYPGLVFEEPQALPNTPNQPGLHYFHPVERLHRVEGVVYYLVGLDTATSVLPEAMHDYEAFLKNMKVE